MEGIWMAGWLAGLLTRVCLTIHPHAQVKYPDNFHRYDYNFPTDLPPELLGRCDVVVLDPPYLNVETLREYFVSARLLAKPKPKPQGDGGPPPCIVVTGGWVWGIGGLWGYCCCYSVYICNDDNAL